MSVENWKFASIWNDCLLKQNERPYEARDYMYASELGNSFIDRYLKMIGTKPTNPPNNRSLRKFQAGNIWEWIAGYVLRRAGIMKSHQLRASVQLDGCLRVSGKIDYVAGGVMDYGRALNDVDDLQLPELLHKTTIEIVNQFHKLYGTTNLLINVAEIKSVGSFVFERILRVKKANDNHYMQNYHYLEGSDINFGRVIYICRDDCRIIEFPVYKPSPHIFEKYQTDIQTMSDYYIHKELPLKEDLIVFDEAAGRFSKNWKVEYSAYLTKLYKFKEPMDYATEHTKIANGFNSTFKRCVNGDKMTDLNKQRIKDAKKLFPEWDRYVSQVRESGALEMVEDDIEPENF